MLSWLCLARVNGDTGNCLRGTPPLAWALLSIRRAFAWSKDRIVSSIASSMGCSGVGWSAPSSLPSDARAGVSKVDALLRPLLIVPEGSEELKSFFMFNYILLGDLFLMSGFDRERPCPGKD